MQEGMMIMTILKRRRKRNDGDHECRWDPNRPILDWQDCEKSQLCYFFAQTFRLCCFLRFFKLCDGDHECRWDPNRSFLDWQITPDARYTGYTTGYTLHTHCTQIKHNKPHHCTKNTTQLYTLYLLLNVKLKLSPYNMMHLETLLNSNALQWLHF